MSSTNEKATPTSTSADPAKVDAEQNRNLPGRGAHDLSRSTANFSPSRKVDLTAKPQTSPAVSHAGDDDFSFPTETEIYILPNGQVVFADLPAELIELAEELGSGSS